MRRRRKRSLWGPRLAVLVVLLAAAGGVWLALGYGAGGDDEATTTARTVVHHPKPHRPKPHPKPAKVTRLKLPATLRSGTVTLPILMYHRIDVLSPDLPGLVRRLTVDPGDFEAQMTWLRQNGYHAISQRQAYNAIVRGKKLPRNPVLITFDDGYRDVLHYAAPLLHRMHMPATAYVITDRVNGDDTSFFRWNEVRRLDRLGFDIGSHSVSHPDLTTLSDSSLRTELVDSRRVLEKHIGHPVQWFAYPAGAYNSSVVDATRRAGYVLAVTTQPGADQDQSRPLELHRYEVLDSTGVAGLAAILGG